jgi:ribosome-associated protein
LIRGDGHQYPPNGRSRKGTGAQPSELTDAIAAAAASKKAQDIVILDMRGLVTYTDFLVIASGRTPRQTQAIAAEVRQTLKDEYGLLPHRVEGEREGEWILLDMLDAVFHCFTPEAREFYRLELLWRDAPRRQYEPPAEAVEAAR